MEAKRLCLDMISNLPPNIIENILCLVPIQEAVRTSILSKEWRYHWTKIPKLVFMKDMVKVSENVDIYGQVSIRSHAKRKLFYAINQVMLMHQGPIHEFTLTLSMNDTYGSRVNIDQIIEHLSRNNNFIKKLKLDIPEYSLPSSLFSFSQLTDLYLRLCHLDIQPTFIRLGSLTTLYMDSVCTTEKTLLRLLSNCPLLKSFTNSNWTRTLHYGFIKYIEDSNIINLFECLPVIEYMSLPFIKCSVQDRVPDKLPTALVHLKYLCIEDMCFVDKSGISGLVLLIRSSPNLEKLKLKIPYQIFYKDPVSLEDYSDIWLERLNELEIESLSRINKHMLDFVKLILAKSPMLKKVRVSFRMNVAKDEELQLLTILLSSPRASPEVEIIVEKWSKRTPFKCS